MEPPNAITCGPATKPVVSQTLINKLVVGLYAHQFVTNVRWVIPPKLAEDVDFALDIAFMHVVYSVLLHAMHAIIASCIIMIIAQPE